MVMVAFTGVAHASSPTDPPKPYSLPIVYGFHANPAIATVGHQVTFFANVTGGVVTGSSTANASNLLSDLTRSGYHILWFFGGGNATADADLLERTADVPANASCNNPCNGALTPIEENWTYQSPGSYNVSITVYDSDFNFTIATTTVEVSYSGFSVQILNPCHSASQWPGQVCSQQGVNPILINSPQEFNAQISGTTDAVQYLWDFGDGNTSSAQFARHGYARNGTYMVSVTATDSVTGEVARAFLNLSVKLLPVLVPCRAWPAYGTVGVPINFTFPAGDDPNPDDYQNLSVTWSFGDGTTGTGLNTTHIYTQSGSYNPVVSAVSDRNVLPPLIHPLCSLNVGITINGTLSAISGMGDTLPVGQVATFDAANYTNAPAGSALLKYSWTATTGSSYGRIGRASSFSVRNESVGLTVNDPYASSNLQTTTYANFTDVKPTVGVDSIYTQASITVTIGNTYAAENVTIVLMKNGANVSWYNLWWYDGSVTFYPIDFQMADQWTLMERYTPYSGDPSGSSSVTTEFDWTTDTTAINAVYHTHTFYNSDPLSENVDNITVNHEALGQWAFLTENLFSPAQTNFTETDDFGFGTPQSFTDPAPAVPEPTLDSYPWEVDWPAGANYTFNITACDDWGMCNSFAISVYDYYNFTVSDIAPQISAPTQVPATESVPGMVNTFVDNVTSNVPENASSVVWQFGDGASQGYDNVGNRSTVTHVYRYGSRYAVIVYAASQLPIPDIVCRPSCYHQAPVSANWSWFTVNATIPEPSFTLSDSNPVVDQAVTFDGALSRENGQDGFSDLAFSWDFGDGSITQGLGEAGAIESHAYTSAGTYAVTLTVQDPEGISNSTSETITVSSTAPSFSFPGRTMTVDSYTVFTPPLSYLTTSPLVRATWDWGDGTLPTAGSSPGHTYLLPGNYTATLNLSGGPFGMGLSKSGTITVQDEPLTVVLPYGDYVAYGENHTESFGATVLGSYADYFWSNYTKTDPSLGPFNYSWNWGDGTNDTNVSHTGYADAESHEYLGTSIYGMRVTATSPFPAEFASTGTGYASVTNVPDSDSDGLPDAYETAITHTNPYWPDSAAKSSSYNGTGLTDYVGPYLSSIGNLTADPDSDGLTTLQEILGSVTGFPSNPLDPNTAGDGIPDGSHFFSQTFRNDNVSSFTTGNAPVFTNISDVWYAGPAKSFHSASILVQVNTSVNLSLVSVYLYGPSVNNQQGYVDLTPGGMSSGAETFTLVNSTPTGGEVDHYSGIGVSNFQQKGTWKVAVDAQGNSGQIVEANIALSYYTNPSRADPTHSGLLQGHGITVPIVNCTEPSNVTYPVYNPTTWKITRQPYFPYTEEYYKLSIVQGVPFVLGTNQSVYQNNSAAYNASTNCSSWGVSTSVLGKTASYLGDADFGISPWVQDVTGDTQPNGLPLTNGMKALGAAVYDQTADHYLDYKNDPMGTTWSQDAGYLKLPDTLTYPGPLNPSVASTQFDGASDGYTMAQTGATLAPLALAVTITSATDTNCYGSNPIDQVSVTVNNAQGGSPTVFSQGEYTSASSNSPSCPYYNNDFNFNDQYTLPLNNSQSEFNLTLVLWHNFDVYGDNKASWSFTDQPMTVGFSNNTGSNPTCNGGCNGVQVSWQVEHQPRAPTVLVANQGETTLLPGYGLHYAGEQQFYAFYIDVTGSSSGSKDPFQTDPTNPNGVLNVVLLSRATYLETNLSTNLSTNNLTAHVPALASCLGSSDVTARNPGGSQMGLAGTFSGSMNDSCANLLLQNLMPRNSTGNVTGTYYALNSTQVQLLGFLADTSQVVPFLAVAGYDSPMGGPPQAFSVLGAVFGTIGVGGAFLVTIGTYFHVPALVALGDFLENLPAELAAVGQVVLGVLSVVYQVVSAVVQAAINVLNFLLQLIEAGLQAAFNLVIQGYSAVLQSLSAPFVIPLLSILAGMTWNGTAVLSTSEYSGVLKQEGLNPTGSQQTPESPAQADSDFSTDFTVLTATIVGLEIGWGLFNYIMQAMSAGTEKLAKASLTTLFKQAVIKSVPRAIETGVGFGVAIGASAVANDLSDGTERSVLKLAGLSAGEIVVAIQLYDDMKDLQISKSFKGIVAKQQLGILISLPFGIFSDIMALLANGVVAYSQSSGDTHLHTAAFIFSLMAIVLGAAGTYFTLSIAWKVVEQVMNIDPMGTILGLGLNLFGFVYATYTALNNPA